jgi:cytidine deaminase
LQNFFVGAAGLGLNGAIYLGANLELPGHGLNSSVHAEQSMITNAAANRESGGLASIAVTAAPCGHCRQFMMEMRNAAELEITVLGQDASDCWTCPLKVSWLTNSWHRHSKH